MRVAFALLLSIAFQPLDLALADDNPDVAAAVAKIVALGGKIRRDNDNGGAVVSVGFPKNSQLRDHDLALLKPLTSLRDLNLNWTSTSDAGLKHIGGLKELRRLFLHETNVSDVGLTELAGLQNLEELYLSNTAVTERGIKEIVKLKKLQNLNLPFSISDAVLKELKETLPDVLIQNPLQTAGETGGQRPDPTFDVSIAHPVYTEKHPSVLFDEAHHNFHTASGHYKMFANLITNDGYRVTPNQEALTPERLAKHDVLIIANATAALETTKSAFSEAECDAVQKWVQGGGSLLLVTDHEPFASASDELGKRFGVEMSLRVTFDPANQSDRGLLFARDKNQLGDHPIMTGRDESEKVNRVLTFTGQSIKGPPGSVALLKFADTAKEREGKEKEISVAGGAQGVALKYDRGRVVVMGEAAQLSAQIVGNPPRPMGMNVPGCDNRQMALNVMHWLSGLMD